MRSLTRAALLAAGCAAAQGWCGAAGADVLWVGRHQQLGHYLGTGHLRLPRAVLHGLPVIASSAAHRAPTRLG